MIDSSNLDGPGTFDDEGFYESGGDFAHEFATAIREMRERETAEMIGKVFGFPLGMMSGIGPAAGWKLGSKIGSGLYSMFGNPDKPSKPTADFSFVTANQGRNDAQQQASPIDILEGIFKNKGNVDVDAFINSLLSQNKA